MKAQNSYLTFTLNYTIKNTQRANTSEIITAYEELKVWRKWLS